MRASVTAVCWEVAWERGRREGKPVRLPWREPEKGYDMAREQQELDSGGLTVLCQGVFDLIKNSKGFEVEGTIFNVY